MIELKWPEGLDAEIFLRDYWQRRPLLMRGALAHWSFPLTPEALAGLALEPEVESRLVTGRAGRWTLRHGPFDEALFHSLPERDWTLLVQDVDKHLPETAELMGAFHFLPAWRFDDLMVSYAEPGGSVGPHIDSYDVFLIQGRGRRRWEIATAPRHQELLPDLPLRILARFEPEHSWVLEQGDVLYLPPGVAHWGVAETPTMNWSVGLRDPGRGELLDSFAQFLLERLGEPGHYRDPPLRPTETPGHIDPAAVDAAFEGLDDLWRDPALRRRWFGCFVTEPKPHLAIEPPDDPPDADRLRRHLAAGGVVVRHPYARLAWSRIGEANWLFYCGDGRPVAAPPALLEALCSAPRLTAETLAPCLDEPDCLDLLLELLDRGILELDHE